MSVNVNEKSIEVMENQTTKEVSRFRSAVPQVLAVCAKNLILFDLGLCIAFPTIVIPAVQNSSRSPSLDDEQTSWFGSISMICQPVGSVMSGLALERLGRKTSLMVVNAPLLLAWAVFYFVSSPGGLLATSAFMGLSVGLVEAPILTYVAEVSQPELRGMLTSFSELCLSVGMFCQYLIGTVTDWRTTAAISAAVPIISVVAISQVPESPAWLMSRGRHADAGKSLRWLRGWVSSPAVQKELSQLARYHQEGLVVEGSAASTTKVDVVLPGTPGHSTEKILVSEDPPKYYNVADNLRAMLRPETLRPLMMVLMMSFLEHWCGVAGTRPYMVQVFEEFGMPIDAHWATVATGLLAMCGMVVCVVAVPWCGKRPLVYLSVAGVVVCCALLGTYAYLVPPGGGEDTNWMPLALFITLFFTHSLGLNPVPWMLLSEVFPFRTRSLAAGAAAAVNYAFSFAASKTFLGLKANLGLHGVYWLYAAVTALGSLYLLVEFKETEGKTLQDIEAYYTKKLPTQVENSKTPVPPENMPRVSTWTEEVARDCRSQGNEPSVPTNGADDVLPVPSRQERSVEGSTNPAFDETAEANPSTRTDEQAAGAGTEDCPRETDIPGDREDGVEEEFPSARRSSGEPGGPAEGDAGEEIALTHRAVRRLPSLPGDADLPGKGEESPEGGRTR